MPNLNDSLEQHLRSFTAGALAACASVTFTNPWEVAKTRLQLQGEISKHKVYKNALQALVSIAKNEQIRGLQRGLFPAYIYQILLNGFRLGMYEPVKGTLSLFINPNIAMVSSAAATGVIGAFIASPFFLIKTRMQSFTGGKEAVGYQHQYVQRGLIHSLKMVLQTEGIKGLWRGADASMLRTGVGSAVQLPSYDIIKHRLYNTGYFNQSTELHFAASLCTSFLVCVAMNPFDVSMTRMYNQKDSHAYKNVFDCMAKTMKHEGPLAFYKGFGAHYLRIG